MFFEIYNPNPAPWNDLDANFVNNFGIISLSIPIPLSLISKITTFLFSSLLFFLLLMLMDMYTYSLSINLTELVIKLVITWFILSLSVPKITGLLKYYIQILYFTFAIGIFIIINYI